MHSVNSTQLPRKYRSIFLDIKQVANKIVHKLIKLSPASLISHELIGYCYELDMQLYKLICVLLYTWTNLSGLDFIGQTRGPPPSPLQAS